MNTQTPATTHLRRSLAAGAAAAALFSFATLSLARSDDDFSKVTVSYADLDLSHPAGAAVLYRRIHTAAKEVCSPLETRIDAGMQFDACVDAAVLDAVKAVNRPALSAVLDAKRRTSPAARLVSQISEAR
jgi:UrcA family protein